MESSPSIWPVNLNDLTSCSFTGVIVEMGSRLVEFKGSRDVLIAAGIAREYMFATLPKRKKTTYHSFDGVLLAQDAVPPGHRPHSSKFILAEKFRIVTTRNCGGGSFVLSFIKTPGESDEYMEALRQEKNRERTGRLAAPLEEKSTSVLIIKDECSYKLIGVPQTKDALLSYAATLEDVVASLRVRANELSENARHKLTLIAGGKR